MGEGDCNEGGVHRPFYLQVGGWFDSTLETSVFVDIGTSLKERALGKIIGTSNIRFYNLLSTLGALGTSSENLKNFCEILIEWWGHE